MKKEEEGGRGRPWRVCSEAQLAGCDRAELHQQHELIAAARFKTHSRKRLPGDAFPANT